MDRMPAAYEEDFYAWTQVQAEELRRTGAERNNAPIDWENVAEEIVSIGRSQKSEIRSRLRVLLIHILQWQHCPELRERCGRGWRITVREQREQLGQELADSRSLRPFAVSALDDCWRRAVPAAADEADVPISRFPSEPTFTLDDALDPAFPPDLFPPELRG